MSAQKLVRMANEIARNMRTMGGDQAAIATAAHLKSFWTPGMRASIIAHLDAGGEGLEPLTRDAVERLRPATNKVT
jgi:formate dehydrogenase subunit delta